MLRKCFRKSTCRSCVLSLSVAVKDKRNEQENCRKLEISCLDQIWANTWSSTCFIVHYEDSMDFLIAKSYMSMIKEKKNLKRIFSQINCGTGCFFFSPSPQRNSLKSSGICVVFRDLAETWNYSWECLFPQLWDLTALLCQLLDNVAPLESGSQQLTSQKRLTEPSLRRDSEKWRGHRANLKKPPAVFTLLSICTEVGFLYTLCMY